MPKTYKRETAWAMLFFLVLLCLYDLIAGGGTAAFAWAELFAYPVSGFCGLAFGMDVYVKQRPRLRDDSLSDHDWRAPPDGLTR